MRNYTILLLLLFVQVGFSQVGIGTTAPTPGYDLDVDGSLLIQEDFKIMGLPSVTTQDDNFKLLLRRPISELPGEVARLDLSKINVAPINVINYEFYNLDFDNLRDVDLQFNAEKYIVGLSNVRDLGRPILKGQ